MEKKLRKTEEKTAGARSKALLAALLGVMMSLFLLAGCAGDKVETSSSDPSAASSSSQSVAAYESSEADEAGEAQATAGSTGAGYSDYDEIKVSVEIDPSAAAGKVAEDIDTTIFGPEEIFLAEGETAYDALVATGATIEGDPSYVTSINGLASGAVSSTSGWMYKVNDESPMVSANEYRLTENDVVLWYYVDSFE